MGYYPVTTAGHYDRSYWEMYQTYKVSPIAEKLMQVRVELVEKHAPRATIVDIGIGSGHFIEKRARMVGPVLDATGEKRLTLGYDVNPIGIMWLLERGLWCDPWATDPRAVTCWDSLEHMSRPGEFIGRVKEYVFVSIPIFRNLEHVLVSKHFKPKEHFWYFTRDGLVEWMRARQLSLMDENRVETTLGREDIGTFVFRRDGA